MLLRAMVLVLIGACATSEKWPTKIDKPVVTERGYVLLKADASLYQSVDESTLLVDQSFAKGKAESPHYARAYRLIKTDGNWMQVETIPGKEKQCVDSLSNFRKLRVRFWTKKNEAFPVLLQKVTTSFQDGTGYTLLPGLPVGTMPSAAHRRWITHHNVQFVATIPTNKIGWYYPVAITPKGEVSTDRFLVDSDLKSGLVVMGPLRLDKRSGRHFSSMNVEVIEAKDEQSLVKSTQRCSQLLAIAPRTTGAVGGLSGGGGGSNKTLKPETLLYWPDGKIAGRTSETINLPKTESSGSRECFEKTYSYRRNDIRKLKLCFDSLK